MDMQFSPATPDDAILAAGDAEPTTAAWSLDELDRSSDLDFLRSARSQLDDAGW